jgi:pSer/pThr/pTyr-binding forkhead associated (FHA) protein
MRCSLKNLATHDSIDIDSEVFTIGRAKSCSLILNDRSVSRLHCEIQSRNGKTLLVDLNSRSGVSINDKNITGPQALKHRDIIQLGDTRLSFETVNEHDDAETVMSSLEATQMLKEPSHTEQTSILAEQAVLMFLVASRDKARKFQIHTGETKIGRSSACNLKIFHSSVSAEHAKIIRDGANHFVQDLGSTNGSKLNGKTLDPTKKYKLHRDDKLSFGDEHFTIDIPQASSVIENKSIWRWHFFIFILANALIISWALWKTFL